MPMSEHKFSIDDLIEALLRDQGIHSGHWALNIEFQATGAAVNPAGGVGKTLPGLIVSVNSATLMQVESTTYGAVDAATVNPRKAAEIKPARARKPQTGTLQ